MSLPFFHTDPIDISNHLDSPNELLSLPISSENYILIIGSDLVRRGAVPGQGHTHTYLERLLKGIVVWCTQHTVIQDQDIIHDLHILLHNGALVPLAYMLEEYLATSRLKEQCLTEVLNSYSQVEAIHYDLTRAPFRGYITTGYDTCIETAYAETQRGQLSKYYQDSLAKAVEASRKKQLFILKLYGDLVEPDSIKLGRRLSTGLYAGDIRQQLRQLFCETPPIFIGFDDADQDLIALQSLIPDGYNNLQKHSAHSGEQHDGMTPASGERSSPDTATYEILPGYFLAQPFKSFQNQDKTAKNERLKKEKTPDTTKQEAISVPGFDRKYGSNGLHGDSLPPLADSRSDSDDWNDRIQNQPQKSSNSASRKASAHADKRQLIKLLEARFSNDILDLPDELPLFKEFKSLLNRLLLLEAKPGKMRGSLKKQFTLFENNQEKLSIALIYIPGTIMKDQKKKEVIASLFFAFPEGTFLKVCTDSDSSHQAIETIIREDWATRFKNPDIIYGHHIQDIVYNPEYDDSDKKYWIARRLGLKLNS